MSTICTTGKCPFADGAHSGADALLQDDKSGYFRMV